MSICVSNDIRTRKHPEKHNTIAVNSTSNQTKQFHAIPSSTYHIDAIIDLSRYYTHWHVLMNHSSAHRNQLQSKFPCITPFFTKIRLFTFLANVRYDEKCAIYAWHDIHVKHMRQYMRNTQFSQHRTSSMTHMHTSSETLHIHNAWQYNHTPANPSAHSRSTHRRTPCALREPLYNHCVTRNSSDAYTRTQT